MEFPVKFKGKLDESKALRIIIYSTIIDWGKFFLLLFHRPSFKIHDEVS